LGHAYPLRHLFVRRNEALSYLDLGSLRLAQAESVPRRRLRSSLTGGAARFTAKVPAEDSRIVSFQLRKQRGRIVLLQGEIPGALGELSVAVDLAEQWRGGMATADLQEQIFPNSLKPPPITA